MKRGNVIFSIWGVAQRWVMKRRSNEHSDHNRSKGMLLSKFAANKERYVSVNFYSQT